MVRELLDRDCPVRAVSRSGADFPDPVDVVTADCTDATAARQACENAAVVYNCLNVPYQRWTDLLMPLTENSIEAAAHADAPLVMTDNLYMYGPSAMPLTEETPREPKGPKGRLRVEMEELLMDAHETGRTPVAIGRASDFYGAHANSAARELVFEAALDGKTAAWLGSLDAPHTMTYLPDFAQGLVTLGTHERAFGEVWHLPSNDPITGRRFIEMVYDELGRPPTSRPTLVPIPPPTNDVRRPFSVSSGGAPSLTPQHSRSSRLSARSQSPGDIEDGPLRLTFANGAHSIFHRRNRERENGKSGRRMIGPSLFCYRHVERTMEVIM